MVGTKPRARRAFLAVDKRACAQPSFAGPATNCFVGHVRNASAVRPIIVLNHAPDPQSFVRTLFSEWHPVVRNAILCNVHVSLLKIAPGSKLPRLAATIRRISVAFATSSIQCRIHGRTLTAHATLAQHS